MSRPDTARKAIRRSILKQEGARRVDVMLSTESLKDLAAVRAMTGHDTAKAISWALRAVQMLLRGEPLTSQQGDE